MSIQGHNVIFKNTVKKEVNKTYPSMILPVNVKAV